VFDVGHLVFDLLLDFSQLGLGLLLLLHAFLSAGLAVQEGLDALLLLLLLLNQFIHVLQVFLGLELLLLLDEALLEKLVFSVVGGDRLDFVDCVLNLLILLLLVFLLFVLVLGFECGLGEGFEFVSADHDLFVADVHADPVGVLDVDASALVFRTAVSKFDDFFAPRDCGVFAARLEGAAAEHQHVLGVVFRLYLKTVGVEWERLDYDIRKQE